MFPCQFLGIFKNTYFIEHLQTAASGMWTDERRPKLWSESTLWQIVYVKCSSLPTPEVD